MNAVLQLLVNSPSSWNLFREVANLKVHCGAGIHETAGGAMPLVDAMVRSFREFMAKEEPPLMQQ